MIGQIIASISCLGLFCLSIIEVTTSKKFYKISFFTILFFLLGITWTYDLENYEMIFKYSSYPDIMIKLVSEILKNMKLQYNWLIYIYLISSVILMGVFIKKNQGKPLFIVLNLIIFTLYYQVQQIRYFLAFYLFLCALCYLNNKLIFYMLLLMSLLSHKAIFLMFLFIPFKKFKIKKYINSIIIFNLINYFILNKLLNYIMKYKYFEHFKFYTQAINRSSLLAVIYFVIPVILNIIYITLIFKYMLNKNQIQEKDIFLYKLTLFPLYFIFLMPTYLSIITRYGYIYQIVNLLIITRFIEKVKFKNKILLYYMTICLSIFCFYWLFIQTDLLGIKGVTSDWRRVYDSHFLLKN